MIVVDIKNISCFRPELTNYCVLYTSWQGPNKNKSDRSDIPSTSWYLYKHYQDTIFKLWALQYQK